VMRATRVPRAGRSHNPCLKRQLFRSELCSGVKTLIDIV